MKKYFSLFGLIFCSSLFAQTQSDLNKQANQGFLKADKELNEVYNNILKEYKNDTVFIKSLKKSQKIWIQLRDAEMETKFPKRETGSYGSVLPMCWSIYKEGLTIERITILKGWLIGTEEGNVCAGSVKIIE
jgi:uncharacterized protein YecT (DUF1311 family)